MKRKEIDGAIRAAKKQIEISNEYIKELESMTPDEDKPVVKAWHTVLYIDGYLHIDQWLEAKSSEEAIELCDRSYDDVDGDILIFDAPIGEVKIVKGSYPF